MSTKVTRTPRPAVHWPSNSHLSTRDSTTPFPLIRRCNCVASRHSTWGQSSSSTDPARGVWCERGREGKKQGSQRSSRRRSSQQNHTDNPARRSIATRSQDEHREHQSDIETSNSRERREVPADHLAPWPPQPTLPWRCTARASGPGSQTKVSRRPRAAHARMMREVTDECRTLRVFCVRACVSHRRGMDLCGAGEPRGRR